jgi:putative hemolysin
MELTLQKLWLWIPPLLLLEGFFSGSEIALLSADKLSLKARASQGSWRAKLALSLAQSPERVLSCTLVITSLCMVAISAMIAIYVHTHYAHHTDLVAVAITSPLIVLLGELIPKTIYQRYATTLAPWIAVPVQMVYWILYPITKTLSIYTTLLGRLLRPLQELLTGKSQTGRDELLTLLSYGKRESEITASERKLIKRIFDFKGTQAKDVLIPLIKVEAIEENSTIKDVLERFKNHRHSRMPVYSGRIDNIIGILEVADLFHAPDSNQGILNYISSARYVAETHLLEDLVTEMKHDENEIVVVVDEYGGAVGILTTEDIIEEIVGEIEDEHDDFSTDFKELSDNRWLIQARMSVGAINEQLKLDIPEGDYETISGFLLTQFAKIPETGDELYFDTQAGSLKFTIRKANERQIQSVLIEALNLTNKNNQV